MIRKVFAVRDVKAEYFLQPFFCDSTGEALRAFGDASNEPKTPMGSHPSDYVLYEIGSYDNAVGRVEPLALVRMLACGSDFLKPVVPEVLSGKA